ncbi:MAG: YigZ family protein [Candidatus Cloacimonadaceae bacterium]
MMKTIDRISSVSVKIQRSEFIAFLYPVKDAEQVKAILSEHNEKYKDATHNCYAYVLGKKQETQYYSDQGEPSGTAGKPILNTLLKHHLTYVLAMVTRYYGGVKLGVRGLIDAYSEAVEQVIQNSALIDYVSYQRLEIKCDYSALESLKHQLKQFKTLVNPLVFTDMVSAEVLIPEESYSEVHKILDDLIQREQICIKNDDRDIASRQEE